MKTVRAFLAVPVSGPVREQLVKAQKQLRQVLPEANWVRPEAIHLTLQFFGDVTEEELAKIGRIMLSIGRLHSPFVVQVQGAGAFPSSARPRVIWVGLEKHPGLIDLHGHLRRELNEIGLADEERPFSPHLTLGRLRRRIGPVLRQLEPLRDFFCGFLPVDRLVLFESQLRPGGAVHLQRFCVPLGMAGEETTKDPAPQ